MSSVMRIARPEILALEPYPYAAWDPSLERLHANENPWRDDDDRSVAGLNRYPEPEPRRVEARLAALYGVEPRQVLAGRGSDEGIDLLTRALLVPGRDAALACPPTFAMYGVATRIQGAELIEIPLDPTAGFALDEALLLARAAERVKLVFLCTPNNPTGNVLSQSCIERIAERLEGRALVVVDEAYIEFSDTPSLVASIGRCPNLVVLRTLSKAYALAGARCGAVIADFSVVDLLRRIRPPYALTTPTAEAVMSALEPAGLERARERIGQLKAERERLAGRLAALPLIRHVWPSSANFVLVECRDAQSVLTRARAAGFLLRDLSRGRRTPDAVRISVGRPEQNDRLLAGLGEP